MADDELESVPSVMWPPAGAKHAEKEKARDTTLAAWDVSSPDLDVYVSSASLAPKVRGTRRPRNFPAGDAR